MDEQPNSTRVSGRAKKGRFYPVGENAGNRLASIESSTCWCMAQ